MAINSRRFEWVLYIKLCWRR